MVFRESKEAVLPPRLNYTDYRFLSQATLAKSSPLSKLRRGSSENSSTGRILNSVSQKPFVWLGFSYILSALVDMDKLTVNDIDVRDKRVLMRVDYNVPMEEKDGQMVINDATRIKETLPTLRLLVKNGAKIILMAHLGRPDGK